MSALHWRHKSNELNGVSLGLRFDYEFHMPISRIFNPFAEYGLGVALISDTTIGARDMSSAFHFKNQLGLGLRTRHFDFFVRVSHFSNASMAAPNDGLDVLAVGVMFTY